MYHFISNEIKTCTYDLLQYFISFLTNLSSLIVADKTQKQM